MKTCSNLNVKFLLLALFAIVSMSLTAQVTVTGTVLDSTGESIIGASVVEKGQTGGATTDIDGKFTIRVGNADATLVISYVGMKTQEVKLKGRKNIDVTLEDSSEALSELVVVGYGTRSAATSQAPWRRFPRIRCVRPSSPMPTRCFRAKWPVCR